MRRNLNARKRHLDDKMFKKYTYKYLELCKECEKKKVIHRKPLLANYNSSDIYESIKNIPHFKTLILDPK